MSDGRQMDGVMNKVSYTHWAMMGVRRCSSCTPRVCKAIYDRRHYGITVFL